MTPEQIVKAMAERYVSLKSYQDTGIALTHRAEYRKPDRTVFRTRFQRSGQLRFVWQHAYPNWNLPHMEHVCAIWSDGDTSWIYFLPHRGVEPRESLQMAIASATGISNGTANQISSLLLYDPEDYSLATLDDLRLIGEEAVADTCCHRIRGRAPWDGSRVEMWIGCHDLLVRRTTSWGPKSVLYDEIRRNLVIDAELSPEDFTFTPSCDRP